MQLIVRMCTRMSYHGEIPMASSYWLDLHVLVLVQAYLVLNEPYVGACTDQVRYVMYGDDTCRLHVHVHMYRRLYRATGPFATQQLEYL